MDKAYVITILDGCGYFGPAELQTLIDRCLIKITRNKLMMHTLIQRMGREIIRQLSHEKLGERSRLWNHRDSFKVLKEKIVRKLFLVCVCACGSIYCYSLSLILIVFAIRALRQSEDLLSI